MTMSRKPLVACGNKSKTKSCTVTTTTTSKIVKKTTKRVYRRKKYYQHDLIMEEILTKVPVETLLRCAAVSKSWYNSIHNDKRLTYSHFRQSQKQPKLIFNLANVKVGVTDAGKDELYSQFFEVAPRDSTHSNFPNVLHFKKLHAHLSHKSSHQLVGYCNGLPCTSSVGCGAYTILQPYRVEHISIISPPIISNAHIICHGFGFDYLANQYKLVCLFHTSTQKLDFVVFTLGNKSWRTVSGTPMSHHGHRFTWIRAVTSSDKSGIFCSIGGGCLAWKVIATGKGGGAIHNGNNNNEMEMLLLFNLHEEKFQFIQPPTMSTTTEQQKQLVVDYPHLLEFKGSPCIARLDKKLGSESDCYHRRCHDHHNNSSCCCCCKVHLYILKDEVLKDKVRQVWVKEESFNVRMKRPSPEFSYNAPDPCCFCFGSTTTPPTRILSFSDQILLYWFDGMYLQVFDLRSEKFKLVIPYYLERNFFLAKLKEPPRIFDDGDDNIYCSNMDYQLHSQVENFLSLQTFIPEGVARVDSNVYKEVVSKTPEENPYSGGIFLGRNSGEHYPFPK